MNYTCRIVCLANSRKSSGRCVAGKLITDDGVKEWIRPISDRPTHEISLLERRYQDGTEVELLDIVDIPMIKPMPQGYQQENHLIDSTSYWTKVGDYPSNGLSAICDNVPTLWINGYKSRNGVNNRVPEKIANRDLHSSLVLIKPEKLVIQVRMRYNTSETECWAQFAFHGDYYRLHVTDPRIESAYSGQHAGFHKKIEKDVVACVSLGESYQGFCYKLVASVIDC